jgi:hypothetical protein
MSDPYEFLKTPPSNEDQIIAASKQMAALVGAMHKAYVAEGLPPMLIEELILSFHSMLWAKTMMGGLT